jgi:hypothetical protein
MSSMSSDEQLIERLRASLNSVVAEVHPPGHLLDGISPGRRPTLRLPRLPGAGGVAAVLTSATAVIVAVLAIALLGHARGPATRTVAPSTAPLPRAFSLAALRAELELLRRPQRPSDVIPGWGIAAEEEPHCSNCLNVTDVRRSDTRLLATLQIPRSYADVGSGPERVYLVLGTVPAQWQHGLSSGWRQRGRAAHGLHLSLVGLTGRHSTDAPPADELLNYAQLPMSAELLTPRDVMITSFGTVGVVPDGVTRVTWELYNPGQSRPIAVHPRVRGNVAVAPMTPAPRSTALINEQLLVGATWYGTGGRVLASFRDDLSQVNRAYSPGATKPAH